MGVQGESFGELLRALRQRVGLTQEELAESAGLSTKAISALERGERRRPYPYTLRKLATALRLSPEDQAALQAAVSRYSKQKRSRAGAVPEDAGPAGAIPAAAPVLAPLPTPRQLPPATRDFTGRLADLAQLDACRKTAVVAAIAGTAGVGKTTLALVWAHRVRHLFPDGQLYVNLRGYDPGPPAQPAEVLDGFLRALNVPAGKIPPTVAERAGLFRSLTDGRRMLIVLDNANRAEQVRPLLPGSTSCLVLVTSRVMLTGLAATVGVARIQLELLSEDEAIALLRTVIGGQRAATEPEALADLAELCVRLPLALQVAGQRAAARPRIRLTDLLAELSDETRRLDVLSAGTDEFTALRPVFSWSYRNLTEGQARTFRQLGLHPGPDLRAHAVAALSATSPEQARHLLDGLAEAHLVEDAGRGGFRMHDLLRAFARERATADQSQEEARSRGRRTPGRQLRTSPHVGRSGHHPS